MHNGNLNSHETLSNLDGIKCEIVDGEIGDESIDSGDIETETGDFDNIYMSTTYLELFFVINQRITS